MATMARKSEAVAEVGLVAVEELVEQERSARMRPRAQSLQCLAQPPQRLRP